MTPEGRTPSWGASLSWQSFNVLLQVVLQLVYIRILAGILAPEDFGVMALALIVVGVVEIFAQVGIGPSIVQFPQLTLPARVLRVVVQRASWAVVLRGHVPRGA